RQPPRLAADPDERHVPIVRTHSETPEQSIMNAPAAAPTPPLDRHDAEALAHACHGDAFRILGPHDTPAGPVVRTFQPGAQSVDVLRRSDGRRLARLAAAEPAGLFQGAITERAPYLLRIAWPDAVQETEDPYSFGSVLGELDLHLFNEGR